MNSSNSFETPISNFRRLIEQDFSDKFQIIFCSPSQDKSVLEISQNVARLISKKINDLYMIDPTIDKYELSIPFNEQKQEDNKDLLNLIVKSTKEQVKIPQDKQKNFALIRFLLGESSSDNIYDIQNIKEAISLLSTELDETAVKYLNEHFLELIESGEMKNLSEEVLFSIIDRFSEKVIEKVDDIKKIYSILKNQEDEEIVVRFIMSVKFKNQIELLKEMIEYFCEHLNDRIVENELPRITSFIRDIFEKLPLDKLQFEKLPVITKCNYSGNELSGIISHLKSKQGDKAVTLSAGGYATSPITNLIDCNKGTYYANTTSGTPTSEADSWIEFDFGKRKVNLTSYTIQTHSDSPNCRYKPKTWRIVGSNDHEAWTFLNRQVNCSDLNGYYKIHRFECNGNDDYYQYIRYIQEDSWDSSSCKYSYSLSCFELFGSIAESAS